MASGTSSLESNGSNESIPHSYVSNERHPGAPLEYEVLSSSQCYEKPAYAHAHAMSAPYELGAYDVLGQQANEGLKQQCEKALHDLAQLRRQHSETSRRCEHVMKELEYFRGQHRAAMNQLEVSAQEASSLRGKYGDLLNDNQRLEREVQHLQQNSGAEGSDALVHTLRKYEALKEEFDCFQKRYDDLIENHNTSLEKLRIVQEENSRLKTQCHELTQERNAVIRERNALKQQVASVVRQWEGGGVRERADIKRLTDERNAAMAEYTLIMSERDTVHKEMEKLSDDLQAALKRVAALESALQASREEQRATALQAESLRREIESALVDRDRAIKECTDLKTPQNTSTLVKSRQDNSAYHHLGLSSGVGTDGFLNGQHSNDPSMDKLQGLVGMVVDAVDKERVDNLEQANQEIERLRKQADRLQAELNDAQREAEVSKRRRDWAFSERDKLLQERESVKALCNRLRKDFEWEIIDVELSGAGADALGLQLCGGRDEPHYPHDCSVYVAAVQPGSAADGKIKGTAVTRKQPFFNYESMFYGDNNVSVFPCKQINNRSLEGVKSASEATALLNDCQYDCVLLTVLRPLYPCCDPRNRSSFEPAYPSNTPSAEEPWGAFLPPAPPHEPKQVHIDHGVPDFDRRYVYHVAAGSQGKIHQERGTWDMIGGMIRGKIEAVTGGKSKDKQNKVPESDAIAELDSVIDSYHGKTIKETSSVLKRSRRKNKEAQNDAKNGGTWPKARANFILEDNATGTIVQPRSRKERPPLSILLSPPTKLPPEPQRSNTNRNSNPIPLGHVPLTQVTAPARHSVYKSIETSPAVEHFPKPAPLAIHNPFAPPNMSFDKNRTLEKDKISISDYEQDVTPNRLSLVLNPSEDSLFYQPALRNRTKSPHSLDFMVNKGPTSLDFVTRKSPSSLDHSIKNHTGKDILDQYYSSKKSSSPKTVNKYPSDSDSFGPDSLNSNANFPMTGTLPTQSRLQSQYYRGPFTNSNPHASSRYPHLSSPTNIPQSQSGESIGTTYDMHSFTSHTHNMSDLNPVPRVNREYQHTYEGGTFPRKKENQRFRIPSNPSVTSKNSAGKLSTGSIERSSERNSPMPTFHVEVLSPGRGAKQLTHKLTRNSMPEYCGLGWNKPLPGELRRVHIDKSQQPLGIQIYCPPSSGGVFVSTVNENSLASQVGLQIGDQLLEVCGINMRSATYTLAASVLRQIGNSITMLVQYSPEKYKDEMDVPGSSSSGESSHDEEVSLSGSPTPRNSPGPQQSLRMDVPSTDVATLRQSQGNKDLPRFLLIEMRNCSDLGISLVGGNAVGIFVHSVQIDSPAYIAGLRTGDQILEYNNVDLRRATAEQAALELAKPADKGIHCIVDVSVPTIEKLHKHQIYPIVLFIKFKSFKQIKEVKDTRYPADKVSAKAAKEMYEHGLKVENEYRNYISAEIPAGVNIAYMCTQIKEAVEEEQNKTLTPSRKSVTFCTHCKYDKPPQHTDADVRYYSDPGQPDTPKQKAKKKPKEPKKDSTDSDLKYYSEPDAKYFEIDYEFLKELRKIARKHCPKCKRKRLKNKDSKYKDKSRLKPPRNVRMRENFVLCNGRYHSDMEHCQLCCKICNRSTDTLDSMEDEYSLASKSYSLPSSKGTISSRSKSTPSNRARERKNSVQSNKSVSFLESSNEESLKDEPNYTASSFTNDLKKFLLKPSSPRLSLREKFIISFKQELEATKKSPKLKAIKGLWKSY
ncbi:jg20247 [Pararge aegeria aegeria]|uniref:Jg20247 protein n=1 Tax=Pararge aegeria aegeria TaxID=348720 RepID=A0A8S4R721_9NEOP|nr:jg20247 [Pararge aegeria aegeria]